MSKLSFLRSSRSSLKTCIVITVIPNQIATSGSSTLDMSQLLSEATVKVFPVVWCLRILSWPKPCKPPIKGIIQVSQTWAHGGSSCLHSTSMPRKFRTGMRHALRSPPSRIPRLNRRQTTYHASTGISAGTWHVKQATLLLYLAAAKDVVFQNALESLMRGTRGIE